MLVAELRHLTLDDVGAVVGDDAMRIAVAVDELADEIDCCLAVALLDRFCFDPLCKLVDCDQHMRVAAGGVDELAHHVESPDREGSGDGDSLESRAREVRLMSVPLAYIVVIDDVECIGVGRWPVEAMAHNLGD